jgi:hypothetical protein
MTSRKAHGEHPAARRDETPVPVVAPGIEIDPSIRERAEKLILGGLGKAELEIAASYAAPFWWVMRNSEGEELVKSGSLFFLDTGRAIFAVTAAHVVVECLKDTRSPMFVQSMIGTNGKVSLPIHLGDRIIDAHVGIDIATFRVTPDEILYVGRTPLKGYQPQWPPRLIDAESPITYCGFPGVGRRWVQPRTLSHGMVPMAGMVTNVSATCISVQIEREVLVRILGTEEMPENFDFGGMSGGPALAIVQRPDLMRFWRPAGVIFQGPNPSGVAGESIQGLEIIRIRPIHFVKPDGMLDLEMWDQCNPV